MAKRKKSGVGKAADDVMRERARSSGTFSGLLDWLMDHRKVVVPAVLIVSVALTIAIALIFSRPADPSAGGGTESEAGSASTDAMQVVTDPVLVELVNRYLAARTSGDMEMMETVVEGLTQPVKLYHQELSRYVESFTADEIYQKPGPEENSYILYLVGQRKFYDHPQAVPSMESLFVRQTAEGSYVIFVGEVDEETNRLIGMTNLSDDVVDLNNKINAAYNEMVDNDKELAELISAVSKIVNDTVAEALAAEQNAIAEANNPQDGTTDTPDEVYLRAQEVINIRSEASAESELVGTTTTGSVYRVVREEGEWSVIEYNGGEAFVKTEFFEVISAEEANETLAANAIDVGVHVMSETCNIREDATTDSDVLGLADAGKEVTVLEVLDNGWSRIRYQQIEGFVMTEFIGE